MASYRPTPAEQCEALAETLKSLRARWEDEIPPLDEIPAQARDLIADCYATLDDTCARMFTLASGLGQ